MRSFAEYIQTINYFIRHTVPHAIKKLPEIEESKADISLDKFHSLPNILKNYPGLFILIFILLIISLTSLKPNLYIIGWDNHSSYFNQPHNLFETFFATWREYRGLGVPSDSEATDLFRQILYLVLTPVMPKTLISQIYILLMFAMGALLMYALAQKIYKRYIGQNLTLADLFAFLASFFYIFNLNTLATFYFPMVMYVSRFALIPLLLLFSLRLFNGQIRRATFFLYVLGFLLLSSSFITATILITVLIMFALFSLFQKGKRLKLLVIILFYLSLQSFWLFPFFNYTIEKSGIIRLAPTYITANEAQLNKPSAFYDLGKQLILYPNFFDTKFLNSTQEFELAFHPLTRSYTEFFPNGVIWVFPFLYLTGAIIIIIKYRKYRGLLWIPITIYFFLFLSLKEFSPVGFLYKALSSLTPYFDILFRFPDTKFHPLIAFAGSLGAAFFVIYLLVNIRRLIFSLVFPTLLIILTTVAFNYYFTGHLVGFFMYNKIPGAYFEIASLINKDKDEARVLHLPFDKDGYWKSYAWGAVGSSFINFMLDHPLIDKTWQPGSMENAYLDKKLASLISNAQTSKSLQDRISLATKTANLLKKIGVKYIILDNSVQATIPPRGLQLWGKFNLEDSRTIINDLNQFGMLKEVKTYKIDLNEYVEPYSVFNSLSPKEKEVLGRAPQTSVILYELRNYEKPVSFIPEATFVDPYLENLLETNLVDSETRLLQDSKSTDYLFYPFLRRDASLTLTDSELSFKFPENIPSSISTIVFPPSQNVSSPSATYYMNVYAKRLDDSYVLSFKEQITPSIEGQSQIIPLKEMKLPFEALESYHKRSDSKSSFLSNWSTIKGDEFTSIRIKVGDSIIPLPEGLTDTQKYLGTVAVKGRQVRVAALALSETSSIPFPNFLLTENPNCFFDKLKGARLDVFYGEAFKLESTNQSACMFYDVTPILKNTANHLEFRFSLAGESFDLDKNFNLTFSKTGKPRLKKFITEAAKPNYLRLCIRQAILDECLAYHHFLEAEGDQDFILPIEKNLDVLGPINLLISIKNTSFEKQTIIFKALNVDIYSRVFEDTLEIPENTLVSQQNFSLSQDSLSLTLPKAISSYSYFKDPKDGFYLSNQDCELGGGYRTFRIIDKKLFSYVEDCYNTIFHHANFSSDNFMLYLVSYNLASGKYPRFIVDDNFNTYMDEYLSLYQGYPDIKGFKKLQASESWSDAFLSDDHFKNIFDSLEPKMSYGFITPRPELHDTKPKDFTIQQDSENEGLLVLDSLSFQPLPNEWENMAIKFGNPGQTYSVPQNFSFENLLPSLKKVSLVPAREGESMLFFNSAYDRQWRAYSSLAGVIFGLEKGVTPVKCDGYANCFRLENMENLKEVYIFYTPERLSILGWLGTLTGLIFFLKKFTGRQKKEVN